MKRSATGDPIADLRSGHGALISLYADRPSPGGYAALLSDLVKPLRDRAAELDRTVYKSVVSDTERIHDLAESLELGSAPSYAVFASNLDDVFRVEPLGHQVPNVATLGPRPYLRPLRTAIRSLRAGIIAADRVQARTFVAFQGVIDELEDPLRAEIGKSNFGGFSGYAEHKVRSRADLTSQKLWKEAASRLLESHVDKPFDYVAIGGHEETIDEIAACFHSYLATLPRVSFPANPQNLGVAQIRTEIAALDEEVARQRDQSLAGRVCDTAWSGGNAVLGLSQVLEASNAQAIEILAVAGEFSRPGAMCDQCSHLRRDGERCPVCSSEMYPVEDVVGAAMDATVAAGGKAVQLGVASPLDTHGVGALTRFGLPE